MNGNLYEGVHFFNAAFLKFRPLEVGFKGKLIFKSVGLVRVGSNLSGFVIEDKEEAGIDIIFVEMDGFEFVPEIALIAYEVPAELFLIEAEIGEMFVISSFEGFEVLFIGHFLFFWEWENVGNLCFVIIKCSVQLSTGVFIFELVCVAEDLDVCDRTDVDFFKLEIESHVWG